MKNAIQTGDSRRECGQKGLLHCPVRAAWQFRRFFMTQPNWTELNCRQKCNGGDDEKQNSPWRDFMHIYHNFTRSQGFRGRRWNESGWVWFLSLSVAHIKNNRRAGGGILGQFWRGVEIAFCLLRAMTFMTVFLPQKKGNKKRNEKISWKKNETEKTVTMITH